MRIGIKNNAENASFLMRFLRLEHSSPNAPDNSGGFNLGCQR